MKKLLRFLSTLAIMAVAYFLAASSVQAQTPSTTSWYWRPAGTGDPSTEFSGGIWYDVWNSGGANLSGIWTTGTEAWFPGGGIEAWKDASGYVQAVFDRGEGAAFTVTINETVKVTWNGAFANTNPGGTAAIVLKGATLIGTGTLHLAGAGPTNNGIYVTQATGSDAKGNGFYELGTNIYAPKGFDIASTHQAPFMIKLTGSNYVDPGALVYVGSPSISNAQQLYTMLLFTDGEGIPWEANLRIQGAALGNLNDGEVFNRQIGSGSGKVSFGGYGLGPIHTAFFAYNGLYTIDMKDYDDVTKTATLKIYNTAANGTPANNPVVPYTLGLNIGIPNTNTNPSTGKLLFLNHLDMAGGNRQIAFGANSDPKVLSDWVELKGNIINSSVATAGGLNIVVNTGVTAIANGNTFQAPGVLLLSGSNSYNGATTMVGVNAGSSPNPVVSISSFNSLVETGPGSGVYTARDPWSSLGAPTTIANATILMNRSITLRYIGTGEDTNRPFNQTATDGNANTAMTIENNGSGALRLLGAITSSYDTPLTLQGLYPGTNEFKGISTARAKVLIIDGAGTWKLTGDSRHTGVTRVNSGKLLVDMDNGGMLSGATAASGSTASSLMLAGGTFEIKATGGGTQVMNQWQMRPGASVISLTGNNVELKFTNATPTSRSIGGSMHVDYTNATGASGVTLSSTTSLLPAGGVTGWMTVKDSVDVGFARVEQISGVHTIKRNTIVEDYTGGASSSSSNYKITANTEVTYAGSNMSTLAIDTSSGAGGSLNLGSATLDLAARGLLVTGTGNYEIKGTGQLGIAAELFVHQYGTGTLTISSQIGTGAASLIKTGEGILELTGNNSYTGLTYLNQGTLRVGNLAGNALSKSSFLSIADGILEGNGTLNRALAPYAANTALPDIRITGGRSGFNACGGDLIVDLDLSSNANGNMIAWGWAASTSPQNTSNTNDYSFNPYVLVLNDAGASHAVNFKNNIDLFYATRTVEVAAEDTETTAATMSGVISGAGNAGLTKIGEGRLILSATNTYDGETLVKAGRLDITGKLLNSPKVTVNDYATLSGNGHIYGVADFKPGSTFHVDFGLGLADSMRMTFHSDMDLASGVSLAFEGFADFDAFLADKLIFDIGDKALFANLFGDFNGNFSKLYVGTNDFEPVGGIFIYGEDKYKISQIGDGLYVELIPEPAALALLVGGLGVLALVYLMRLIRRRS